jgi:hypothetical protein
VNLDEPIPSGINGAIFYDKYLKVVLRYGVKDPLQAPCKFVDAGFLVVCGDDDRNQFFHIGLQTLNKVTD